MSDVSTNSQALPLSLPRRNGFVLSGWSKLAVFLTVGYLCLGRSFAYLGLPWFSLYIGEMALGAFLLFGPRTKQGRWLEVVRRIRRLRRLEWVIFLLLCYGGFEALRGILHGYPALTAVRDTAFNYYPLYIFLGIWVGLRHKTSLRRFARALAWWNGCYGIAYVLFLSWFPWTMPGTAHAASRVPVFSEPYNGSAIALLGLIAFEPRLRKVWYLVAMNAFVLLGLQVRSEWVGFAAGGLMFVWLTKRFKHLAIAGALFIVLLAGMYVTHLSITSPKGRGGGAGTKISVNYLFARALAPLNKNLASEAAPSGDVRFAASTAEWRLIWWVSIWHAVNANTISRLLGFGYGYPLGSLNPLIPSGDFIQTPHNDFFYALAYSGWLGVLVFVALQLTLLSLLWRAYRVTGQPFGLMCWAAFLASSMFTEFFEGPFGAIPFYLIIGMALAPAMLAKHSAAGRRDSSATAGEGAAA